MRQTLLTAGLALLCGCLGPVNVAWRGVINHTSNQATTDGRIDNRPAGNRGSVAAEKTNDFDTSVRTPDKEQ